jgi:hypothetical protein
VLKRLVYAHVIVAPTEVGGSARFDTGTRAASNGIHTHVIIDQPIFGQWQQSHLNASGKAARIGYVLCCAYPVTIDFRQSIDVIVARLSQAEVLSQVNYLDIGRNGVFAKKLAALAVSKAKEYHIHLVEWQLVGKGQVRLAIQTFVHVCYLVTGIAAAVDKLDFGLGVIEQQANQLSSRITCATYYSYSYHIVCLC